MRMKLLILSIIASAGFSFADDAVLFGNVLETDLILTPAGVTNAILATALTAEHDPVAYPVATNALAVAEGALQPSATNGLPVAVAHAQSAHGLTDNGGFAGGDYASAEGGGAVGSSASAQYGGAVGASASAQYGGAVGASASAEDGGAVGSYASAEDGGAVGYYAYALYGGAVGAYAAAEDGGAVGSYASAQYGGAVGSFASAQYGGAVGSSASAQYGGAVGNYAMTSSGFAGGYRAMAALDDTGYGTAIDAIQLGTGWNPDANTLQIYDYKLMNADGSIPAERMASALSGYATTNAVAAVQAEVGAGTNWLTRTGLSGTVAFANDGGRPQAWSGSGALTVSGFTGLTPPTQVYWTLSGFDSVSLPSSVYLVGGGSWQTNAVNHFTLWAVGTNTMMSFITTTTIED